VAVKFVSANTYTIGIARLTFAALGSYVMLRKGRGMSSIPFKHWLILLSLGLLFGLHWLTLFLSIKIASASIASIGLSTYGVHLIILGWFFRKNAVTLTDIFAVILAIIGSIIVIPEFTLGNNTTQGICLSVISGFFYASLPIIHQKNPQLSSSVRAFGQFLFALVFFLAFFPLTDWNLDLSDWMGLLFLAVACTFVAHSLWVRVTTVLSTVTTSMISYLVVPVSLLLSHVLLHEPIGISKLSGATLIIIANLVGLSAQWKQNAFMAKA
jgi:drug/metabolite transporter (DMT)-like permease